jgi:hypothetical protein
MTWEMLNDAYLNKKAIQRATEVHLFEQHDSRITASRFAKHSSGCGSTLIPNAPEMQRCLTK